METQQGLAWRQGRIHLRPILIGALVIVVIGAAATLAGWDITSWFKHVWDTLTKIPLGEVIAAIVLISL